MLTSNHDGEQHLGYKLIIILFFIFIQETLKNAHGTYTPVTVSRAAKLPDTKRRMIYAVFAPDAAVETKGMKAKDYTKDIEDFSNEFQANDLFTYHPGWQHKAFPAMTTSINEPKRLKARLMKY